MSKNRSAKGGCSVERESQNPPKPGFRRTKARRVDKSHIPSPAHHQGKILLVTDHISDGRRHDSCSGIEFPKLCAVGCAISDEHSIRSPLEYEISGCREHTAAHQHRVVDCP